MLSKHKMKCRLCFVSGVPSWNIWRITFFNGFGSESCVEKRLGSALARLFIRVDSTMELRILFLLLTFTYVIARKEQQYVSKRETHCGRGF